MGNKEKFFLIWSLKKKKRDKEMVVIEKKDDKGKIDLYINYCHWVGTGVAKKS